MHRGATSSHYPLFTNHCSLTTVLLMPQRHHGIDAHRASRREIRSQRRDSRHQTNREQDSHRVIRRESVELATHQARYTHSGRDAYHKTCQNHQRRLAQNHSGDLRASRSQRYANANLVCLATHLIGQQAVKADTSQQHRQYPEQAG